MMIDVLKVFVLTLALLSIATFALAHPLADQHCHVSHERCH